MGISTDVSTDVSMDVLMDVSMDVLMEVGANGRLHALHVNVVGVSDSFKRTSIHSSNRLALQT